MNVTNDQVRHRQFGVGTVINQTMTTITVQFCERYGTKKFLYPSAFESFLTLCNPASKEKMDDELHQIQERMEEERRKRAEEDEKRRDEERRALLELKRATVKKKKSPAERKTPAKPKKQPEDAALAEEGTDK
jgi:hypothetical protein